MGKTFICDEVNDLYTADVLASGHLKTSELCEIVGIKTSAASGNIARKWITAAAYLKDIIVTDCPASSWIYLADLAASASASAAAIFPESTATGGSGGVWMMKICTLSGEGSWPKIIPIDVVLTAGLVSMLTGNANKNIYARILT